MCKLMCVYACVCVCMRCDGSTVLCGVACFCPFPPSRDEEWCGIFGGGGRREGLGLTNLIPWWEGTIIMLLLEMTFGGVAVIPVLLM